MDKTTILIIVIFSGLSLFMLFLFYFILKRDKIIETKFLSIEKGLDELSKEIFYVKKNMKYTQSSDKESLEELEKAISELLKNIKELEKNYILKIKELEAKIDSVRKNVKKVDFSNLSGIDEQRVISMYKEGYSVEEISKELRIPAGEVEFVLKMKSI